MKGPLKLPENVRLPRWGTPNTAGVSIPHELAFEGIAHRIGDATILDHIALTAASGTVTCLLGPSGSGKTTLLRIAAGMERQTSGRVLLDGSEIGGPDVFLPPERRGIGLVFQDYALFPHLTIAENVRFGLAHLGQRERRAQAQQMLSRVGLEDRAGDYPHQLSGGEQQRVALARALAPRPGVLLMDEPFSGLDSRLRDAMRDETLAILRETRATSVIVTHDPHEALRMGDQIVLLRLGNLEQVGSGADLYYQPENLFVAGFFSELNTFEGRCQGGVVETPLGAIRCPDGAPVVPEDGALVTVAVRLDALTVKKASNGRVKGTRGRVLDAQFSGDFEYVRVGLSGYDRPIRARIPARQLDAACLEGREPVQVSAVASGSFVFAHSG